MLYFSILFSIFLQSKGNGWLPCKLKTLPWWLEGNSVIGHWKKTLGNGCRCHLAGKTRSNDLWALDAASRIGLSCASTTSVECFPKTEAVNPSVTDKSKYIPLDVPEPTRWASSRKVTPSQEEWWWCCERPKYQSQKMKYRNTELLPGENLLCAFFWIGFTLPGQSFSLDFNLDGPTLKPVPSGWWALNFVIQNWRKS